MKKHENRQPRAVQDCHDLLAWVIPQIDKMPRQRRFTLGGRIEDGLLEVLDCLVTAAYSRARREWLQKANRRLDVVRHLWRLGFTLKAISSRHYEYGAGLMVGLGRQIGGWREAAGS